MRLDSIDILNFKNIAEARLEFSPGVNCLLGDNGMGKSNLLEAIHFLSLTRPMNAMPESALIRHGSDMLMVGGHFSTDSGATEHITCGIAKGKGKTLRRNGKEYSRISEHIGRFPVVTVTPRDSDLVNGPAETRRRMADMAISQANAGYLTELMRYNRALESRNRMLRAGVRDKLLYEAVEAGLESSAAVIHDRRREWVETITPMLESYYSRIAGTGETASMRYRSQLSGASMRELLDSRRQKDAALGYTSAGPHRDDIETTLFDYSLRQLGSQGQVKTFAIALRLAVFDYLEKNANTTPLLLLDDIFDKLDADRVARIMHEVSTADSFGQIFITDTNRKHLDDILASIGGQRLLLHVERGSFAVMEPSS